MTAALDDVRPIDVPPSVRQAIRWQHCGRLARHASRRGALIAQAAHPDPAAVVYGCPFGGHWHHAPLTADDLVMVAAVARAPLVAADTPIPDPRPRALPLSIPLPHRGLWVVTDPATGRIVATCPPPPSTSTPPAGAPGT